MNIQDAFMAMYQGRMAYCKATQLYYRAASAGSIYFHRSIDMAGMATCGYFQSSFSQQEITSEWLLFGTEPGEKPKPCHYCGGRTAAEGSGCRYTVTCQDKENCWADSPMSNTKAEAIRRHNALLEPAKTSSCSFIIDDPHARTYAFQEAFLANMDGKKVWCDATGCFYWPMTIDAQVFNTEHIKSRWHILKEADRREE